MSNCPNLVQTAAIEVVSLSILPSSLILSIFVSAPVKQNE